MIVEDQTEVVEFLASPPAHAGAAVERIETHASIVFLAATRALKLKRAVRYDYLDFSTAERRKAMCEAEVRINRRTAPTIYRRVIPVTRESDGSLALEGSGRPVDWLVEMSRFDQEGLFDRLAARGALDRALMRPLALAIAEFHLAAERRPDHGGKPGMMWVVDGNATGFAEQGAGILDSSRCVRITKVAKSAVDRLGPLLDGRRGAGFVRHCHGDLHLRNIVLLENRPILFDAIEFNDEIACTDVLYDLAFLLMDLWRRRLPEQANTVWNVYLSKTGDIEGIPLVPLFLSCRAAVRAKTSAASANLQQDQARRRELEDLARHYVEMAERLLHPPPPCLIAVGGFSGSGKSTLAMALAPAIGAVPGALIVRTDEIRKRLCGVDALARLGPEGYTPDMTRRVYDTSLEWGTKAVQAGHAVILDGVFAGPQEREAAEHAALTAHVPFAGLWLDAPEPVLIARAEERRFDPSDAGAAVIRAQLARGSGGVGWERVDASASSEAVFEQAKNILAARLNATRSG